MTNENSEEMKKAEEARASNVKKTLESKLFQSTFGANSALTNQGLYGTLGVRSAQSVYDSSMSSDETRKIRDEEYNNLVKEYRKNGVFGDPSYPSNGDISNKIIKQLHEIMAIAKLGELEKVTKEIGAKLSFEIPEELKNYSQVELIKKAYDQENGKININRLDKKEQDALGFYQILSQSYERACALRASQANYFEDLNSQGNQIAEVYKKEDKGEKK